GARDAAGRVMARSSNADDRNLLDAALDDARDLRRRLGRNDQQKLEEYLDSVRSVEKRLAPQTAASWQPPTRPEALIPPPSMPRPAMLFTSKDNGGDSAAAPGAVPIDPPALV